MIPPLAFFGILVVLVLSVIGLIVLGAIGLRWQNEEPSPHAVALERLRAMQEGR